MVVKAPYGSWKSPISAQLVTQSTISFNYGKAFEDSFYFIEMRPEEKGRYVLCRYNGKEIEDEKCTSNVNVRSRVHEYGGDAFLVFRKEGAEEPSIVYTDFVSQSLYLNGELIEDGTVSKRRFTNGVYDTVNNSLIFVCEDHSVLEGNSPAKEPKNSIVEWSFDEEAKSWNCNTIMEGHDFFSSPVVSPDGKFISFVAWDHPNMPWDNTLLYEFNRATGKLELVAGNGNESIMFPVYSPNGVLYFISDRQTRFWNIFRRNSKTLDIECIVELKVDLADPAWTFKQPPFMFIDESTIVSKFVENSCKIFVFDIDKREYTYHPVKYSNLYSLSLAPDRKTLYFFGIHSQFPTEAVKFDLESNECNVLKCSSISSIDKSYFSVPKLIEIPGRDYTAYGYYYPPTNPDYCGMDGENPIVLIKAHGGPTSSASTAFNLKFQYWTSRGIAIMDVDYIGSSGYGRDYRRKLYGNWGVYDVEDCCAAIKTLASQGLADEKRAVIDGASAGGYTTLACLAFSDKFAAGASLYGVADLELLATDTHKFESRYLDVLIGEYPKNKEIYIKRSPIHSASKITAPLLLLQGDEDKIVPPNQAIEMYNVLKAKGQPVALRIFKGEQHGFRSSEAIIESLESELIFFGKVLNFTPSDVNHTLQIENM